MLARCVVGGLMLAMSSALIACGDDAEDRSGPDGGGDAGGDRPPDGSTSGAGGGGGTGGTAEDDGGAEDAGGPSVTPNECLDRAVRTAGAACVACVCAEGPQQTVACGPECWALVACIQVECGGDGSDIPCITSLCGDFLNDDAPAQALEFDPVLRLCEAPCVAPLLDVGSDLDAGS